MVYGALVLPSCTHAKADLNVLVSFLWGLGFTFLFILDALWQVTGVSSKFIIPCQRVAGQPPPQRLSEVPEGKRCLWLQTTALVPRAAAVLNARAGCV